MIEDRVTIQNRMLKNIVGKYDKTEGSFIYDVTKPVAIELENISQGIEEAKEKLSIENLNGEELEQRVYEKTGINRKTATKASDSVAITGKSGSTIKEGDLVASDTINFKVKETKTIDSSGQVEILVECEEYGTIGNVPEDSIQYFPITIAGITSVTNNEDFTNGYDAEDDEELLARYYEHIRTPATSGNKYHYRNWAKEVTGVGDVKVIPLWNGDNTVKIVIIDSNKQPASQELVTEVQSYIDPNGSGFGEGKAPIGAYCTVESANGISIDVSFTAIKDTSVTDEERQQNIEENIASYLKEIAFKKEVISYNKITSIILDSEGIIDFSNLTINGQTNAISLNDNEVAVLGVATIA
ncbi:baseplate J/gp47 family protein [Wukongibacter baidiensis]|uniref:baseplate J/gp47 family protein n=1 Tax=Wukongibacter baidiensis TaxID=1723361 RepID=UPI003D7FE1C2